MSDIKNLAFLVGLFHSLEKKLRFMVLIDTFGIY